MKGNKLGRYPYTCHCPPEIILHRECTYDSNGVDDSLSRCPVGSIFSHDSIQEDREQRSYGGRTKTYLWIGVPSYQCYCWSLTYQWQKTNLSPWYDTSRNQTATWWYVNAMNLYYSGEVSSWSWMEMTLRPERSMLSVHCASICTTMKALWDLVYWCGISYNIASYFKAKEPILWEKQCPEWHMTLLAIISHIHQKYTQPDRHWNSWWKAQLMHNLAITPWRVRVKFPRMQHIHEAKNDCVEIGLVPLAVILVRHLKRCVSHSFWRLYKLEYSSVNINFPQHTHTKSTGRVYFSALLMLNLTMWYSCTSWSINFHTLILGSEKCLALVSDMVVVEMMQAKAWYVLVQLALLSYVSAIAKNMQR